MDMDIFMRKNSMKNKPLGFQMWLSISILLIITSIIVFFGTIITIDNILDLEISLFKLDILTKLIKLIICIVIISIIAAKMISNTITEPIRFLERKVRLIASKKWLKIDVDRKDEIGKLTYSINKMQDSLERYDKEEEFFLQSLSHELKTPIMVIKNYCQAIKDGIYVNDSFEDTISVIEYEVEYLNKKICRFLYANSLEYILEKEADFKEIDLMMLVERISNRMCGYNIKLEIVLELENCRVFALEEKIEIAIENIIENATRYAETYITIKLKRIYINIYNQYFAELDIINDGKKISDDVIAHLFDKFHKGFNGNFGLGLYISKKIIDFHNGFIYAKNSENTVIFTIKIPCKIHK